MSRPARVLAAIVAAAAVVVAPGCFLLERAETLEPGSVRGSAIVDDDGARVAVPHPGLGLDGSGLRQRGGRDGAFVVRGLAEGAWLLRADVDDDGNGWAERAALRTFTLRRVPHGAAGPRLSAVDLGDVALLPTIEVGGVVVDEGGAPAPGARVYALRADDDSQLQQEAVVSADADGAFRFPALARGTLHVEAVSPDGVAAGVVEPLALDAPVLDLRVTLQPGAAATAVVALVPPPADGTPAVVTLRSPRTLRTITATVEGGTIGLNPDEVGPWNVEVAIGEDDASLQTGRLLEQLATRRAGQDVVRWGVLHLRGDDDCATDGGTRDCDDDDAPGLPLDETGAPVLATWTACAAICGELRGAALEETRCVEPNVSWDCDDDGDGQPDVTEPLVLPQVTTTATTATWSLGGVEVGELSTPGTGASLAAQDGTFGAVTVAAGDTLSLAGAASALSGSPRPFVVEGTLRITGTLGGNATLTIGPAGRVVLDGPDATATFSTCIGDSLTRVEVENGGSLAAFSCGG